MVTRAIVTSQPDVACYVCERRLLRGEQPEVFIADGRPRTVCELCTPRAAREGWPREHEGGAIVEPPVGRRRGRGLMGRLRLFAAPPPRSADGMAQASSEDDDVREELGLEDHELRQIAPERPQVADGPLERAVAAFNDSQYARRAGSLARSLGAPEVSVHLDEGLRLVEILVAWELCWYRYRIDPDEEPPEVVPIAEGTELDELPREERLGNALADESGALELGAGRA